MRIALIGYGKMGKAIEKLAHTKGYIISHIFSSDNIKDLQKISKNEIDVAIEFTNPKSAYHNIIFFIDNNIPIVSGTTGWNNKINQVQSYCIKKQGAFLYASNFSIGMNIFFKLNKYLANIMNRTHQYNVSMQEIHHIEKKRLSKWNRY